jgi:hypothetical protein
MKKHFLLCISFFCFICSFAQNFDYGNDWYQADVNRTFIKIIVDKTGIQRLSLADFLAAGHSTLTSVNAQDFRLYFRGKEVPLFVSPTNSNIFDFIEFFGIKNDGRVDSLMYRFPDNGLHDNDAIPNIDVSLFSDSAAYFLTWQGGTGSPARVLPFFSNQYDPNSLETSFLGESKMEFLPRGGTSATSTVDTAIYVKGAGGYVSILHALNSDYTDGEGYQGAAFSNGSPYIKANFQTQGAVSSPITPSVFKARIFGRSESTAHYLQLNINNNAIFDTTIQSVYQRTFTKPLSFTLSNTTSVKISAPSWASNDFSHVSWYSIEYWRNFQFNNTKVVKLLRWTKNQSGSDKLYLKFDNIAADTSMLIYTLNYNAANPMTRIRGTVTIGGTGKVGQIVMPSSFSLPTDLWMATDSAILKPTIKPNHSLADLHNEQGAEFVLITHRAFETSANAYKNYRDSCTINQLSTKVVFVDQIYDEYGYGTFTPWAIKRFCKDALDNWAIKPKYIMLWGKALNTATNFYSVPTICYPWSDNEFVSHYDLNTIDILPQAAIGRVNISTDAEGMNYLAKVNEYEHTEWTPSWMLQGVFLGGGQNDAEASNIKQTLLNAIALYEAPPFGGTTTYFQKLDSTYNNDTSYHQRISDGVSWIQFFGHATPYAHEVPLYSPYLYNNNGKYPFIFVSGCNASEFGIGNTLAEKWILEPQKGAIGHLGGSGEEFLTPAQYYTDTLCAYTFNKMIGQRIGDILKMTFKQYIPTNTPPLTMNMIGYRTHARQQILQGDPTIRLHIAPTVSIEEMEILSKKLNLYPNPTQSTLYLTLSNEKVTNGIISIYDQLGKIQKQQQVSLDNSQETSISVADLPTGIYILTFQTDKGVFVKRFVRE